MAKKRVTKVQFLVNDGELFAYFPEEDHNVDGSLKTCYAHVGQHSACHPDYAKESKEATKEAYLPLLNELVSIGYDLKVLNKQ